MKIVPEIIYIFFVSSGENYYPRLKCLYNIFIYHYIFVHVIVYSGTVFEVREESRKIINDDERERERERYKIYKNRSKEKFHAENMQKKKKKKKNLLSCTQKLIEFFKISKDRMINYI